MPNTEEYNEQAPTETPVADVEMIEGGADMSSSAALPFAEGGESDPAPLRVTFMSFLTSPVVTLLVGSGETETLLTAHQALLSKSPFFQEHCAQFSDDGSPRQIELPGDDIEAVGSFLEYLYTGDYFPKKVPGSRQLESDPSVPQVDETGDQLLKHARVYTLAEKFGVENLKNLAASKIHCVNSTAKGEISYARYVYAYTSTGDRTIRAPVASFWAMRSHTLRSEAEEEFRGLCLEFPQFGYDVLTRVLDEKLKRERQDKMHPSSGGSARKRARHSNV
ncbi:hypothetical protein MKZ38_009323 [Zalerion maritima]|uniref:BTB domain-containing protein n=1 Tax=Zalerion maritima TaxID=339359 RepID=A0AAD5WM45_9PEZI|nr:hypothetical protein MKZ38_009323 [Zalerion maritima]